MRAKTLLTAALLSASLGLCAKEIPLEIERQSASNSRAVISQAEDVMHVPVALRHANRISVKDGRIERFISDASLLDVRHDAPSGSLYVIPLTTESTPLYVVTQSGKTHALMLSPKERIGSQNLQIREPANDSVQMPALKGLAAEEQVQEIFRTLPSIIKEEAHVLKTKNYSVGPYKATPLREWKISGLILREWMVTARLEGTVNESAFWIPGVIAVASEKPNLKAGEKTILWTIHQGAA